jgi:hypothetical protein
VTFNNDHPGTSPEVVFGLKPTPDFLQESIRVSAKSLLVNGQMEPGSQIRVIAMRLQHCNRAALMYRGRGPWALI